MRSVRYCACSKMAETGCEYEAESIIARRKNKGKVEYLVRWKGCGSEEDSWKPYRDLPFAHSLVKQFLSNFHKNGSANGKNAGSEKGTAKQGPSKSQVTNTKNGPKSVKAAHSKATAAATAATANKTGTVKKVERMNNRPARQPPVTRKQRGVPTKVTDIAKKVLQRSTRTLQKVSSLNNMPVRNSSQRRPTAGLAASHALSPLPSSSRSGANNKPNKNLPKKTSSATSTKTKSPIGVVTRVRSAPATTSTKPPAKKSPATSSKTSVPVAAFTGNQSKNKRTIKTAKRVSLPTNKAKKSLAVQRTSKSLSPQSAPNKPKNNTATNARKRKLEVAEDGDSSDDDVLYSLASENNEKPPKAKHAKLDNSTELHKLLVSPGTKSLVARRALLVELDARAASRTSSRGATPESDPEISFKQLNSPGRRLLLKDSIKSKPKTVQQVARSQSPLPTVASAAVAHTPGTGGPTGSYKIAPGDPNQALSEPNPARTVDSMDDFPHIPVMPLLPNSPAAASYKSLVKHISSNLQPSRGYKKKGSSSNSEEAEPVVERRTSVRQSESAFKYKDIVVRKFPGYTQVWLFSQTKLKNAFNPKVFQELTQALHNAKFDDSRLVMLSGSGSIFSSGLDLHYLTSPTEDRRTNAKNMAEAVREFASTLVSFPKPIVAAVNGPAIGLGAAILPLCDIVYASDKASFYCPYARLCQTPEACSSFTFPQVMGMAMANEMLLAGRKLTAIEAYEIGLVSQVFWPTSMMQEVVPRVQNMAAFSAKSLEASKVLIRSHQRAKLQFTIDTECQLLAERWASSECQRAMHAYLDDEQDLLV